MRKGEIVGVPHFNGMFYDDFDTPFPGEDLYDIYKSNDPIFKTRVYNLKVEDFHTYYVGELGVWVHNRDCLGLELLNPAKGHKVPDSTPIVESKSLLNAQIKRFVEESGGYPTVPESPAAGKLDLPHHSSLLM